MGRCRPAWVGPLLAAAVLGSGCVPRINSNGQVPVGAGGLARMGGTFAMQRELTDSERRVRALEQKLAERDREIAAVRAQIDTARASTAPPADGAREAGAPPDLAAEPSSTVADAAPLPPSPPPSAPAAPARADATGPDAGAAQPVPPPGREDPAAEQRLAAAESQVASLERRMAVEVQRRQEVEAEMARLLQETSSGPYEQADGAVEKHLRQELHAAREEISELRTTLATERRERQDLEQRYRTLQARVQTTSDTARGASSEEIEALKERQRRVLASIQQDLQASRQREAELRQTLQSAQGGVSLANEVTSLRSENSALQMRLDEEHRHNRDLSAKLQLATRVTDLIFKMQSGGGSQPAVAQPAVDAR